jgi:hypothetical protein
MLPGKRIALVELLLRERPFGGVRTFLGDRLGFEQKPKRFFKLLFCERFLCFGPALRFISSEMRNCGTGSKCLEKTTRYSV